MTPGSSDDESKSPDLTEPSPHKPSIGEPSPSNTGTPSFRHSQWKAALSVAGAAMRGVTHVSRLDQAVEEVYESAKHSQDMWDPSHHH